MQENPISLVQREAASMCRLPQGKKGVVHAPPWVPSANLEQLLDAIDVKVIGLSECLVGPGHEMDIKEFDTPSFHYILRGRGLLCVSGAPAVAVGADTFIVVPPKCAFHFEPGMVDEDNRSDAVSTADANEPVALMCGIFQAIFDEKVDLFDTLSVPVIEQFSNVDALGNKLKSALGELIAQDVGADAVVSSAMKQVIISLVRQSFSSLSGWTRRFAVLSDMHVADAFSEMQGAPDKHHTVESLSAIVGLKRSSFTTRFINAMGKSPMSVLRSLRMRTAALQLASTDIDIDEIAKQARYGSAASFARAFKGAYDLTPMEYRKRHKALEKRA